MNSYVLDLKEIDKRKFMLVGSKSVNLGELFRIPGLQIPEGFCITSEAFKEVTEHNQSLNTLIDQLSLLELKDRGEIGEVTKKIREIITEIEIDKNIKKAITEAFLKFGSKNTYAVRSSATVEDLPHASFAGQYDTYLNIEGIDSILYHIKKCWASLFTDHAVTYCIQNGFHHSNIYLSVIVQQMVFPQVSGIMFTADPITSNRRITSIDASFGLGEGIVSGLVNPDNYKVQNGKILCKKISAKKQEIFALQEGGTAKREVPPGYQKIQSLADHQILQLEAIGRKIQEHFVSPQDIEWCLFEDKFYILQSRPITTLYPVPEVGDGKNHVFMSWGHTQMMTDAIKPLGISFLQLQSLSTDFIVLPFKSGGRLFYDITHDLASPEKQKRLLKNFLIDKTDMKNSLLNLIKRNDFIKTLPKGKSCFKMNIALVLSWVIQGLKIYRKNDVSIIQNLLVTTEALIQNVQKKIAKVSGDELFEFILQDLEQLNKVIFNSTTTGAIMATGFVFDELNKNVERWLGEKKIADILSQSVYNNITSEMGLALMDVADVVRQYPEVIEYFNHALNETFFEDLSNIEGGNAVSAAIKAYLEKYGMRCTGEIDITRPRWSEKPTTLIAPLLVNIKNFEPNASSTKFEKGRIEAEEKKRELLRRLIKLPGGKRKAKKTEKMISVLRNFIGCREYPKYFWMRYYQIYKSALMKEAVKLMQKGVIQEKEDIYYLSLEELRETVRTYDLDYSIITERKAEYTIYEKLTPPRFITSEGEVIFDEYSTSKTPEKVLMGIPASSGIIEGRARVVLKLEDADIEHGDILVTSFTDPSWTPLLVSVKGLITEVGGVMTHGAVITREYGIPSVVGVDHATKLIKDGQRVLINGTEGYVELL